MLPEPNLPSLPGSSTCLVEHGQDAQSATLQYCALYCSELGERPRAKAAAAAARQLTHRHAEQHATPAAVARRILPLSTSRRSAAARQCSSHRIRLRSSSETRRPQSRTNGEQVAAALDVAQPTVVATSTRTGSMSPLPALSPRLINRGPRPNTSRAVKTPCLTHARLPRSSRIRDYCPFIAGEIPSARLPSRRTPAIERGFTRRPSRLPASVQPRMRSPRYFLLASAFSALLSRSV